MYAWAAKGLDFNNDSSEYNRCFIGYIDGVPAASKESFLIILRHLMEDLPKLRPSNAIKSLFKVKEDLDIFFGFYAELLRILWITSVRFLCVDE